MNNKLSSALQGIEDAILSSRNIIIRFDISRPEENHGEVDVTAEEDGLHLFSDCAFETFEEALIELGNAIIAHKGYTKI